MAEMATGGASASGFFPSSESFDKLGHRDARVSWWNALFELLKKLIEERVGVFWGFAVENMLMLWSSSAPIKILGKRWYSEGCAMCRTEVCSVALDETMSDLIWIGNFSP